MRREECRPETALEPRDRWKSQNCRWSIKSSPGEPQKGIRNERPRPPLQGPFEEAGQAMLWSAHLLAVT